MRTENRSGKISSEIRSTKSAHLEGTVPFLMCNTVVKWSFKKSKLRWDMDCLWIQD